MKPAGKLVAHDAPQRSRAPFAAALILLVMVFLLGGSSKDYAPGLLIVRPLAAMTLAVGLYHLTREDWRRFRLPFAFMAASVALIGLHLVPLPPSFWMALPGRELAVASGEAAGIEQPWRPLSLVPYRAWNALFAMLVPAAVMVCAAQLSRDQHRTLALAAIGGALISALWGAVQAISGYSDVTFFYGAPRVDVPNGLFANRNHLAALLVVSVPLFTLIASRATGERSALVIMACLAMGGFSVMMALATGSRAGIVTLVLSIASSALVWRAGPKRTVRRGSARRKEAWVPYALAAFGLATLGLFALLISQTTGFERLVSAGSGEVEEHRLTVWRTILEFAPSYAPWGTGIGSFVEVFKVHEPTEMLAHSYWNHAHNDWLEWAMEGGVPALVLMALALVGWAVRAVALLRSRHHGRIEIQLALTGVIILLILGGASLVDYPLRTPALASVAALAAIWMALPDLSRSRPAAAAHTGGFAFTGPNP